MRSTKPILRATQIALFVATAFGVAGDAFAQSQAQINAVRQSCRNDYMAHCSSVTPGGPEALHCLQQHLSSLSGACQTAVNAIMAPAGAKAKASPAKAKTAAAPAEPAAQPAAPPAETAAPAAPPPATPKAKAAVEEGGDCGARPCLRTRLLHPLPWHPSRHRRGGRLSGAQRKDPVGALPACARRRRGRQVEIGGRPRSEARSPRQRPLPRRHPSPRRPSSPRPVEPPPLLVSPREEMFILRTSCRRDYMQFCRGLRFGAGRVASCLHYNAANLSPPCQAALAALREGR